MKTKMILFIAFSSIVTLSFTFVATRGQESKNKPVVKAQESNAPVGGLISEETR
jgi:hypothetical protein